MTASTQQRPVAEGLFTWPAEPQLIGSSCQRCTTTTFPTATACPRCGAAEMREVLLPRRGTLWTFTTQGFPPKHPYALADNPETFEPFALGYVELPGHVRVEGHITEADPERLRIGMEMDVVIVPFRDEPDGTQVMTFAFAPVT